MAALAARQFNRVSRAQLEALGVTPNAVAHRVATGRLVIVEEGVFALAPVLAHDEWGGWMGATLTAPGTRLSHVSAAAAFGAWDRSRPFETVTRPGNGGPRRHGGLLVYRSTILVEDCTTLNGVPITTGPRTVFDLARVLRGGSFARLVREMVRLEHCTVGELVDCIGRYPRRHGARRLAATLSRYSGLALEKARSGAEVQALETLRDAGLEMPRLNVKVAGVEADLSWPRHHLIIEIDGGPFHKDVGEDARKEAIWRAAGWRVQRIDSGAVYDSPQELLGLAPKP